jgi:hypothetical protein
MAQLNCTCTRARARLSCRAARAAADRSLGRVRLGAGGLAPAELPHLSERFPAAHTICIKAGSGSAAADLAASLEKLPCCSFPRGVAALELRSGAAALPGAPALLRHLARLCPSVASVSADAAGGAALAALLPWQDSLTDLRFGEWLDSPALPPAPAAAAAALASLSRLVSLQLGTPQCHGSGGAGAPAALGAALSALSRLTRLEASCDSSGEPVPAGAGGGGGGGGIAPALRAGGCASLRELHLGVPVGSLVDIGSAGVELRGVTGLTVNPR